MTLEIRAFPSNDDYSTQSRERKFHILFRKLSSATALFLTQQLAKLLLLSLSLTVIVLFLLRANGKCRRYDTITSASRIRSCRSGNRPNAPFVRSRYRHHWKWVGIGEIWKNRWPVIMLTWNSIAELKAAKKLFLFASIYRR